MTTASSALASAGGVLSNVVTSVLTAKPRNLAYFDDVRPIEWAAIKARRDPARGEVKPLVASPDGGSGSGPEQGGAPRAATRFRPTANPRDPKTDKMTPQPIPCDATGLALSGGGIRSAATCLGAIQALHTNNRLFSIDYLSTVSGGGYIGCSLTAALSRDGGGRFPFGDGDISDSPAVAHLRNFSNYLLPRGRSGLRNAADIIVLLWRGLIANLVITLSILLFAAAITALLYPRPGSLGSGSFLLRPIHDRLDAGLPGWVANHPFNLTLALLGATVAVVFFWALLRSNFDRLDWFAGDTHGGLLTTARRLVYALVISAILDAQPLAIHWIGQNSGAIRQLDPSAAMARLAPFLALASTVALFASRLGRFLETSQRTSRWTTLVQRLLAKLILLVAALILPALIWLAYLLLSAWPIYPWGNPWFIWVPQFFGNPLARLGLDPPPLVQFYFFWALVAGLFALLLTGNGYSLHRFYRDRLSDAFLFKTDKTGDVSPIGGLRLSGLRGGAGPYPIINAALNVQGSTEANKRGRNAEFFTFTPDFVGSNLTLYARTQGGSSPRSISMETVDSRLDLGTVMAISGAAVSANMGSNTVRAMSATLALLNIRLGYWLRNPRYVGTKSRGRGRRIFGRVTEKFYLFAEMLNQLKETSREIYLTDGGHIDNLGLYELLKRGCRLILVVDAEADPNMSFESLLKVEKYARIDLGVRIVLPWERIAQEARKANDLIAKRECPRTPGPHVAVGRIIYPGGHEGLLVYFKASVSGDEKDYLLDYKLRNPDFPHETTGDQFFSEEQFEMYRALGFHIVQGFFDKDVLSHLSKARGGFASRKAAFDAVSKWLPPTPGS